MLSQIALTPNDSKTSSLNIEPAQTPLVEKFSRMETNAATPHKVGFSENAQATVILTS